MSSPEQSAAGLIEREQHAPELYDYRTVVRALEQQSLPEDSIAIIGDAVEFWRFSVPDWANIQQVRSLQEGVGVTNDQVQTLLREAEQLLTSEYQNGVKSEKSHINGILRKRPNLFYAKNSRTGEQFIVRSAILGSDQNNEATLYITDGEHKVMPAGSIKMLIDIQHLDTDERTAMDQLIAEEELRPL